MTAVGDLRDAHLRVARATDDLAAIVSFYRDGLGFAVLGEFADHDGFDGVMLGSPEAPYHLEFTRKAGHRAGRAPTMDNLLVFYLSDSARWQAAQDRMQAAGFSPVASFNPYWDKQGATYEDPDGYRVVLQNSALPTAAWSSACQNKASRTGFECSAPILKVADMAVSLRYYVEVLGFVNADWSTDDFACVSRDRAAIYLCQGGQGQGAAWVWIGVENVESLYAEYRSSSARILHPPANYPWALEMKVADADGHVIRFGSEPRFDRPWDTWHE